jgi:hypothetical protein
MDPATEAQAIQRTIDAAFDILAHTGSGRVVMTDEAASYLETKVLGLGARGTAAVLARLQVADESYPADIELIDLAIDDYSRVERDGAPVH